MTKADPFREVDLNLLRALDALLALRSVSEAALSLGLSQPAMSHALNRLRGIFNDALLVRTSGGMTLTPAARAIAPKAGEALGFARTLFTTAAQFDPAAAKTRFVLAMPEHVQLSIAVPLLKRLEEIAPGVSIELQPLPPDIERVLESGEVDLVLSLEMPASDNIVRQKLIEGRMAYAVRKGHPALKAPLTRKVVQNLPHVLVVPTSRPPLAGRELLGAASADVRVILKTPSIATGLTVLAGTDAMLQAPQHLLYTLKDRYGIEVCLPDWPLPKY